MKTLLSRSELATRWGVDVTTVDGYERDGVIKRVFEIGWPKYSLAAVEIIEAGGVGKMVGKLMAENEALKIALDEANKKIDVARRLLT
jgi:hypothetical protein